MPRHPFELYMANTGGEHPGRKAMRFPRQVRLSTKADFRFVFSGSLLSRDRCFRVLYRENSREYCRLGMAVSLKNCRKANGRNRIKRVIRESFRQHQVQLSSRSGFDIVVLPTTQAASICNKTLGASLRGHWQKMQGANVQLLKTDNRKKY